MTPVNVHRWVTLASAAAQQLLTTPTTLTLPQPSLNNRQKLCVRTLPQHISTSSMLTLNKLMSYIIQSFSEPGILTRGLKQLSKANRHSWGSVISTLYAVTTSCTYLKMP